MPGARVVQHSKGGSRVARGVAAAAVLALGAYAASQSFAVAVRQPATNLALRLAPNNAAILALQAEQIANGTASPAQWDQAAQLARRALRRDPLQPSAAVTLGIVAGLHKHTQASQRAFTYSLEISRRNLKAHLWAIEYAVEQGRIPEALRHYDAALKTSKQAPEILFPVLANAVASDDVRDALLPVMLKRPVWALPFSNFVAISANDPRSAPLLLGDLRSRGFMLPVGAEASMLGALASRKSYAVARDYLSKVYPQFSSRDVRYPSFAGNPPTPSPFDWNLQNDDGLNSDIQRDKAGGTLSFTAVGGASGPLLRQLLLLPPGIYEIGSRLKRLDPSEASLSWLVQCVDGTELARLPVKQSDKLILPNGKFAVRSDCPAQLLALAVNPSDSPTEVSGEMAMVKIRTLAPNY